MKYSSHISRLLSVIVIVVMFAHCSSSSSSNMMNTPPANVAGEWTITATNAGSVRVTNCFGVFVPFEGVPVSVIFDILGITCGPITVTQMGSSFMITPRLYTCGGLLGAGMSGGGGTVTANSISGQLDITTNLSLTWVQPVTGSVSGLSASLDAPNFSVSGTAQGGCTFSPPLEYLVTITPAP